MCENENILKCKWSCMLLKSFVLCMRKFMKNVSLLYMILKKSKEIYIFIFLKHLNTKLFEK